VFAVHAAYGTLLDLASQHGDPSAPFYRIVSI
jgi:hypothetical protein